MSRGRFIAFEGQDASGKQTQSKLLAEKIDALLLSFPRYETVVGKEIQRNLQYRSVACDVRHVDFAGKTEHGLVVDEALNRLVRQALFLLDRYDAAPQILDALDNGRNVVADRYWVSGLIYGASDLLDAQMLERVHACLPQPDVWILLDVPAEESFRRRPKRLDTYESDLEKCKDVRQRYLQLFVEEQEDAENCKVIQHLQFSPDILREARQAAKQKWAVIDGTHNVEQVHNRVLEVIL